MTDIPDDAALAGINPGNNTLIERFWSKVDKSSDCWIWTGYRNKRMGYGRIGAGGEGGKLLMAHRLAWELHFGPIPENMIVMHKCDNPPCVNPAHLRLGTVWDNNQDRDAKNRNRHLTGEESASSKLTEDQVRAIMARLEKGETTISIAKDFPVKRKAIGSIKNGNAWSHITGVRHESRR